MWSSCMLILLGYPYGDGLMGTWGCWGCCSSQPRLTPAPPFLQNMPNVRDHDASVYLRLQGDALSVGGYESNPIFWEEVSGAGRLWGERGEFAGDPHQWGGCSSELLMAPHCPAWGYRLWADFGSSGEHRPLWPAGDEETKQGSGLTLLCCWVPVS